MGSSRETKQFAQRAGALDRETRARGVWCAGWRVCARARLLQVCAASARGVAFECYYLVFVLWSAWWKVAVHFATRWAPSFRATQSFLSCPAHAAHIQRTEHHTYPKRRSRQPRTKHTAPARSFALPFAICVLHRSHTPRLAWSEHYRLERLLEQTPASTKSL